MHHHDFRTEKGNQICVRRLSSIIAVKYFIVASYL